MDAFWFWAFWLALVVRLFVRLFVCLFVMLVMFVFIVFVRLCMLFVVCVFACVLVCWLPPGWLLLFVCRLLAPVPPFSSLVSPAWVFLPFVGFCSLGPSCSPSLCGVDVRLCRPRSGCGVVSSFFCFTKRSFKGFLLSVKGG